MVPIDDNKASLQGLSILHFAVAALFFLAVCTLLLFSTDALSGHYFHPKILAITHLAVLGWGVLIIFGALYQFLPVISCTRLYSKILAFMTFILLILGTGLLAYSFWYFKVGVEMQTAGLMIFTSFICFVININFTLKNAEKWSIAADFIQSSSIWLIVTALIGTLMVFNFRFPFLPESHLIYLKVHAHTGIIGWFLLLIIGVASKLLPMFLLTKITSESKLKISYWLINLGLIIYIVDYLIYETIFPYLAIVLITIGICYFLAFILTLVRSRIRKKIDVSMKQSLAALALLLLPIILGFIIFINFSINENLVLRLSLAYGISIFMGFITALILGQTFKTLPLMVWKYVYKNKGLKTSLLPKDLYSEKLLVLMQGVYFPGIIIFLSGLIFNVQVLLYVSGTMLLLTAVFYCLNILKILKHIIYPKNISVRNIYL